MQANNIGRGELHNKILAGEESTESLEMEQPARKAFKHYSNTSTSQTAKVQRRTPEEQQAQSQKRRWESHTQISGRATWKRRKDVSVKQPPVPGKA